MNLWDRHERTRYGADMEPSDKPFDDKEPFDAGVEKKLTLKIYRTIKR
jgi:hypothetical protein